MVLFFLLPLSDIIFKHVTHIHYKLKDRLLLDFYLLLLKQWWQLKQDSLWRRAAGEGGLLLVLALRSWVGSRWKNESLTPQFPRLYFRTSQTEICYLWPWSSRSLAFPEPKSSCSQNLVPSEVHVASSTEESINMDKLRKLGVGGGDIVPPP